MEREWLREFVRQNATSRGSVQVSLYIGHKRNNCHPFSTRITRIDVKDIRTVINYDYPNNSEDYVHRIGRTGRGGETGTAYTFFTPDKYKQAKELIKVLTEANQEVPEKLREMGSMGGFGGGGGGFGGGGMLYEESLSCPVNIWFEYI